MAGVLPDTFADTIADIKRRFAADTSPLASRQSSQKVLERLVQTVPEMIGGSADLTGSNGTKTGNYRPIKTGDFSGTYIHYGVREHAMAAAMNGIALHGGLIPFGGTFLAFADYSRPAIRLAALIGLRVIHVMTHDSIGLGEDGPTHQPVEQLEALRAIPNLNVFRPADAVEVAEAWECALRTSHTPSVLALSRQNLPTLRTVHVDENRVASGAYVIRDANGQRDVTLIATGSEVAIACDAAVLLSEKGVNAAVVSMPCSRLFRDQSQAYRDEVLGSAPRIAVEAAVRDGWDRWIGPEGGFVGMAGFGASAPAEDLYRNFGITAEAVAAAAMTTISTTGEA
jgi:transketolase